MVLPIDQPSWGLRTYNNCTDTNILQNTTLNSIDIQFKAEGKNFTNFNKLIGV